MLKNKLFLLVSICVILLVSVTGVSWLAASQRQVDIVQIETAAGLITEKTETIFEADADVIDQDEKPVAIYTNVIELPQGTITERTEQFGSQPDGIEEASGPSANEFLPMELFVDEDDPQKIEVRPHPDSTVPLSWSVFIDTLYATCSAGAKFEYSSGTGTSTYTLRWSGGQSSNNKTCSGTQCNYTITTAWNANYTYADTQILAPAQVWGPADAYRCN